ncbi:MAG: M23 family metallopeptidase [Patescibacteria group bacterium]
MGLINFSTKNVAFLFLIFGLSTTPAISYAGVISFFSGLLNNTSAEIVEIHNTNINSQNIALLKASVSYDPNPAKGGGGIIVIDNSALSSASGPSGTMADIEDKATSDKIAVYIVRNGDTLSQIAKMFGVSVGTIIWANDIQGENLIKEGQVLNILPISGIKHTVAKGETLASIVKKYKGDLKETRQYNNLSGDCVLAIGDEIIIPGGTSYLPTSVSQTREVFYSPLRGAGGPEYAGYYIRPMAGGRISQKLHGYNAIDFAAPTGTPILASASGTVIISRTGGWNGGYGNYIVIKHNNGTQTLYAHNSKNIVYTGYSVVQGQVIGYVGSVGNSTGPHIHFEIRGAKNPWGVADAK